MIDKTFCLRTFHIVARDMVDVIIKYIIIRQYKNLKKYDTTKLYQI